MHDDSIISRYHVIEVEKTTAPEGVNHDFSLRTCFYTQNRAVMLLIFKISLQVLVYRTLLSTNTTPLN